MGTSRWLDQSPNKHKEDQQDPGRYNPDDGFTKPGGARWGFGSEKRLKNKNLSLSPGAGSYNIPSKLVEGP